VGALTNTVFFSTIPSTGKKKERKKERKKKKNKKDKNKKKEKQKSEPVTTRSHMSETFPKWVKDDIKNAKFDQGEERSGTGYILDINKENRTIDVQFYEKLPEGRYIATLELPPGKDPDSLELATVYMFKFRASKAPLNPKVVSFLKEKYALEMDSIHRFELIDAEKEDVEAEQSSLPPQEEEEATED
jgi:hypothetical protein